MGWQATIITLKTHGGNLYIMTGHYRLAIRGITKDRAGKYSWQRDLTPSLSNSGVDDRTRGSRAKRPCRQLDGARLGNSHRNSPCAGTGGIIPGHVDTISHQKMLVAELLL